MVSELFDVRCVCSAAATRADLYVGVYIKSRLED